MGIIIVAIAGVIAALGLRFLVNWLEERGIGEVTYPPGYFDRGDEWN